MSAISNFFVNYHFLDFTRNLAEHKTKICLKPDATWGEFGSISEIFVFTTQDRHLQLGQM